MYRNKFKSKHTIQVPVDTDDSSYRIDDRGDFISGGLAIGLQGSRLASNGETVFGDVVASLEDIELLDLLGRGNSAVVYKAVHKKTGLPVAVKVLNILEKEKRHQFLKELQALRAAESTFLVKLFGAFHKEFTVSIAMELMDAGTLQELLETIRPEGIPEAHIACLGRQMLEALAHLHKKHQVHRDIKPSNVGLSNEGDVKLMDFGISAQLQDSMGVCDTFVGTSPYMSPERILGKPYSYPSDIWSVGICLLECALGHYPYPNSGVYLELVASIVSEKPPIPTGKFSPEFESFITACLTLACEQRPSAAELLASPFITNAPPLSEQRLPLGEFITAMHNRHKARLLAGTAIQVSDVVNKSTSQRRGFSVASITVDGGLAGREDRAAMADAAADQAVWDSVVIENPMPVRAHSEPVQSMVHEAKVGSSAPDSAYSGRQPSSAVVSPVSSNASGVANSVSPVALRHSLSKLKERMASRGRRTSAASSVPGAAGAPEAQSPVVNSTPGTPVLEQAIATALSPAAIGVIKSPGKTAATEVSADASSARPAAVTSARLPVARRSNS